MQNNNADKFSDVPDKSAEKKAKSKVKNEADYQSYPDISDAVSASDCTGLMYAPPQSEDEFDSYQELSGMAIPKKK